MHPNMTRADRLVRALIVAPILALLSLRVDSPVSILLLLLAGVMLGTSASGVCPLYSLVDRATHRHTPHAS